MSRNIGGDVNDKSYRYKMPKLITKVEGRGNGIKTRLVNMADVGKALHRNPAYPTKFFACELGAQAKINEKNLEYIVNGSHDTKTFDSLLDVFIDKYVLCPNCKLPESDLSVVRQNIVSRCNACGHVANLDSSHRVATFIFKCPPQEKDKVKVKTKKNPQKREDELAEDAKTLTIKEDSDENWTTDVSDAAVQKRREEAGENLQELVQAPVQVEEDDSGSIVDQFRRILKDESLDINQKFKQIRVIQQREKVGNIQRAGIIFEALFTEKILVELGKYKDILLKACSDARTLKPLLGGLEVLLEKHQNLLANLPDILMGLYDFKIVPEDVLISWFTANSNKFVSQAFHSKVIKAAHPFVEWLAAEEEDEEGDEEEEDEEGEEEEEEASEPKTKSELISSLLGNLSVKSTTAADLDDL